MTPQQNNIPRYVIGRLGVPEAIGGVIYCDYDQARIAASRLNAAVLSSAWVLRRAPDLKLQVIKAEKPA